MTDITSAGRFRLGDRDVNRMGYGAMQLAGPHVFGPPRDHQAALAVLRAAVGSGVDHIDTSDYYGPHVVNRLLREALPVYPDNLTVVTKLGARRGADASWIPALSPAELESGLHDNLRNLGLEAMDVVNLRVGGLSGPEPGSIAESFTALARLREQGLIRHLGLSNVSLAQVEEAQAIGPIVCVQNHYNIVHRADDALIDALAAQGIAYVPFFPLGGFSPLQSEWLNAIAADLGVTPMQVALAWLLQRSPNILLIPGTSSLGHLKENMEAANLALSAETVAQLDAIGA
jgi:aryl-alcohol dehydrogenase-like predicted oxidoreductase